MTLRGCHFNVRPTHAVRATAAHSREPAVVAFTLRRRAGFTLLELMLVLGLIVAIGGLAYPALRRPLANQRLHSAAKKLRGELARLRLAAIESGEVQQIQYLPDTPRFRVGPHEVLLPSSQTGPQDAETAPRKSAGGSSIKRPQNDPAFLPLRWEESELPESVFFVAPKALLPSPVASGQDALAAAHEAEASPDDEPTGQQWSRPILFHPDGTSSDARITLRNDQRMQVVVTVRGLTGLASLGELELEEDEDMEAASTSMENSRP